MPLWSDGKTRTQPPPPRRGQTLNQAISSYFAAEQDRKLARLKEENARLKHAIALAQDRVKALSSAA